MTWLHGRQDCSVIRANVVAEELLAGVIEGPHGEDSVTLVENGFGHVGGSLRDEEATQTILAPLQDGPRARRGRQFVALSRD